MCVQPVYDSSHSYLCLSVHIRIVKIRLFNLPVPLIRSQSGNARVSSKLSAYYGSSMLPPPPPPTAPMARPVTIIRSTELGGSSGLGASPPASNTPPLSSSDSTGGAREPRGGQLSPSSQGNDSSSSSRSSFSVSRDYSLSHLHSQSSGQVHYVQTILLHTSHCVAFLKAKRKKKTRQKLFYFLFVPFTHSLPTFFSVFADVHAEHRQLCVFLALVKEKKAKKRKGSFLLVFRLKSYVYNDFPSFFLTFIVSSSSAIAI